MSSWLYKLVPASRADVTILTAIPWALFGNDEGGVFGERDPYHTVLGNPVSYTLAGFAKWWIRNPFHNLFWTVLKWDAGDNARILYARNANGSRWWFRAPQRTWYADSPEPQILVRLNAPFISYRGSKWELYAGWRINGSLGFACRR